MANVFILIIFFCLTGTTNKADQRVGVYQCKKGVPKPCSFLKMLAEWLAVLLVLPLPFFIVQLMPFNFSVHVTTLEYSHRCILPSLGCSLSQILN